MRFEDKSKDTNLNLLRIALLSGHTFREPEKLGRSENPRGQQCISLLYGMSRYINIDIILTLIITSVVNASQLL